MTPEEKLARDRERWQLKKRRQRARKRSAARAGTTIKVEVWHPEELAGYLVRHNLLGDADSTARIENAIEKMFHWGRTHVHLGHWNSGWAQWLPRRLRPETPAYEIKLDEPIMKSLIDFELGRKEKGVTVPDDFAERLREDATALAQIAQNFLYVLYATDMPPNPPRVACDCKRDIEFCDCHRM
jgi:hypothetical protein